MNFSNPSSVPFSFYQEKGINYILEIIQQLKLTSQTLIEHSISLFSQLLPLVQIADIQFLSAFAISKIFYHQIYENHQVNASQTPKSQSDQNLSVNDNSNFEIFSQFYQYVLPQFRENLDSKRKIHSNLMELYSKVEIPTDSTYSHIIDFTQNDISSNDKQLIQDLLEVLWQHWDLFGKRFDSKSRAWAIVNSLQNLECADFDFSKIIASEFNSKNLECSQMLFNLIYIQESSMEEENVSAVKFPFQKETENQNGFLNQSLDLNTDNDNDLSIFENKTPTKPNAKLKEASIGTTQYDAVTSDSRDILQIEQEEQEQLEKNFDKEVQPFNLKYSLSDSLF